jgi:hypothetical protein
MGLYILTETVFVIVSKVCVPTIQNCLLVKSRRIYAAREELKMSKGRLEKTIVDPYLPNKIVPPEYIKDVLEEANRDFQLVEFEYEIPHNFPLEEYKNRYEELEHQMLEILNWRFRWFGKPKP